MTFPVKPLKLSPWLPGTVPYVVRAVFPRVAVLVVFSGAGALAGTVTGFAAGFSGDGTLAVTVNTVFPVFTGDGQLVAAVYPGLVNVDGWFVGDGFFSASVAVSSTSVFPALTGDGTLTADVTSM